MKKTSIFSVLAVAGTLTATGSALAETLLERGTYLMKSIVACGNCGHVATNKRNARFLAFVRSPPIDKLRIDVGPVCGKPLISRKRRAGRRFGVLHDARFGGSDIQQLKEKRLGMVRVDGFSCHHGLLAEDTAGA